MATLRLLDVEPAPAAQGADLYCCSYTADGGYVLSAGWDGCLRLWEAPAGVEISSLQVTPKPLSSCALSPDGRHWLAGSIEGLLTTHDASTLELVSSMAPHTRPISAIRFAPDGEQIATASWDRHVIVRRPPGREREPRVLSGHEDIVAGCRFTGDGGRLLSWSHDRTLRLWDVANGRELFTLRGHQDRVTAAAPSPDGRWAISGGRDGAVVLWDLAAGGSVRATSQPAEVRACFFLLDGASAVVVNAAGTVTLFSTPELELRSQVETGASPLCGDLSPSGMELVLGCEDGRPHFLAVDGLEDAALVVTAGRRARQNRGVMSRLLGKPRLSYSYEYTCPVCRRPGETSALPSHPFPCGGCRRLLRMSGQVRQLQEN
jgi:WD40 repeat protein